MMPQSPQDPEKVDPYYNRSAATSSLSLPSQEQTPGFITPVETCTPVPHEDEKRPESEPKWPRGWRPWSCLFGCFLLMFNSWGLVNAYGTFAAYYREHLLPSSDLLLWNLVGSTESFVVLILSFVVGRLLDANHSRQLIGAGGFLVTLGMFTLSAANGEGDAGDGNYGLIWTTQGFVMGLGMACFFVSSSQVAATWFIKTKATAIGIVASGASIAGLIYPIVTRFLIEALGFNNAARVLAGIIGFTSLLSFLLAVPNPAHEWRKPDSWLRIGVWIDVHAFKNKAFCWFTVGMAFMFFGFYCVFFNLEEWAANRGFGIKDIPTNSTTPPPPPPNGPTLETFYLLAILNACSTIGRLSSAYLSDKFGAVLIHTIVTLASALFALLLWPFANTLAPALAFCVIYGALSGAVIGLPPASVAHILAATQRAERAASIAGGQPLPPISQATTTETSDSTSKAEAGIAGPRPHSKCKRNHQSKLGQWTGMMYTFAAVWALTGPVIGGHLVTEFNKYLAVQMWSGGCLVCAGVCFGIGWLYCRRDSGKLFHKR